MSYRSEANSIRLCDELAKQYSAVQWTFGKQYLAVRRMFGEQPNAIHRLSVLQREFAFNCLCRVYLMPRRMPNSVQMYHTFCLASLPHVSFAFRCKPGFICVKMNKTHRYCSYVNTSRKIRLASSEFFYKIKFNIRNLQKRNYDDAGSQGRLTLRLLFVNKLFYWSVAKNYNFFYLNK